MNIVVSYRTCKLTMLAEWKEKYLFRMYRRAWSVPHPLHPPPLRGAGVGGGGGYGGPGLAWGSWGGRGVTLASQYRELESHLILARKIRGLESHLSSASFLGKPFRHLNWAGFCCKQIWQIVQWAFKDEIKAEKRRVNCVLFCGPVMSHHRHCI